MSRKGAQALAEILPLPETQPTEGWTRCAVCGEEWRLGPEDSLCPPCAAQARERQAWSAHRHWCRTHRGQVLERGQVPTGLRAAVVIETWPRDPRSPGVPLAEWRGEPWSVTLLGGPGVGKSTLAAELAYRWACDNPRGDLLWRRGTVLLREILQGDPLAQRARQCGLLVLDDLGNGLSHRTAWAMLGEVLAERHEWRRATVVTTNLKHPALEAAHSATADRLVEGLLCHLGGRSRRGGHR